jgi:hypothetical protein
MAAPVRTVIQTLLRKLDALMRLPQPLQTCSQHREGQGQQQWDHLAAASVWLSQQYSVHPTNLTLTEEDQMPGTHESS